MPKVKSKQEDKMMPPSRLSEATIGKVVPRKKTEKEQAEYDKQAKIFATPEWIEVTVLTMGERGAKLWRHLKALWGDNERMLRKDWEKYSEDVRNWK